MKLRDVKICCTTMEELVTSNKIVADLDTGTAKMNVLYTPDSEAGSDAEVTLARVEVKYCPGCGAAIQVYGQTLPAPDPYTRTVTHGGHCNDERCPFHRAIVAPATMGTCGFAQALLKLGCWMTTENVRSIVTDLRTSITTNVEETTTDT